MRGRGLHVLLVLSVLIVLSSSVYGSILSVKQYSECDSPSEGYIVMGLSDTMNAHGEVASQVNSQGYDYVLCAEFSGSNVCDGSNKVIGLSEATNAHGEVSGLDNYDFDVCYENLRCGNKTISPGTNGACSGDKPFNVISLSSDTNAHLGDVGVYSTGVCCQILNNPHAFWAGGVGGGEITKLAFVPGKTPVYLVMQNVVESSVDFEIYEIRSLFPDKLMDSRLDVSVDGTGEAITNVVLGSSYKDGESYYFKVIDGSNEIRSNNDLFLDEKSSSYCTSKNSCGDYGIGECSSDTCDVASDELNEVQGVDCYDGATYCFCEFNVTEDACAPKYSTFSIDPDTGERILVDSCEITVEEPDDNGCADGKIEYKYKNSCNPTEVLTNTVACPAEVQLPFFGFSNFLITAITIALIYYFLYNSHSKRKR